jgi:aminoglycoside phosphotransferase
VYLTASTLVPYLLQKGILSQSDLIHSHWCVLQGDSRRPVLRVFTLGGRGLIVKQASPLDRNHVATLDREAAFLQLSGRVAWARPFKALLPRFCLYDPGVHVLIVELLPYDTGFDYLRREAAKPAIFGRLLGRALASVHVGMSKRNVTAGMLSERLPWILQIDSTDFDEMERPSVRRVVELVRGEPALIDAIVGLKGKWQNETLVHGDAKLDNVLVRMGRRPRAWLVDWAFSGIGDPAWDVGTIVHSCLIIWLHGIHFKRKEPFEDALQTATIPLALVRAFIGNFMSAYEDARQLSSSAARSFARRALLYAGAALVQTAVTSARMQEELTPRQIAMMQAASNMLNDPDDTLREFCRGS